MKISKMNLLLDILLSLKVFTGSQLLRSICYELFVWISPIIFPALFFSVLFVIHNTNDLTRSLTIGRISEWTRTHEKKNTLRGQRLIVFVRTHIVKSHTHRRCGPEHRSSKAIPRRSRKSIFLGVHSCLLALWGATGGS